jgi:hypothetical protein
MFFWNSVSSCILSQGFVLAPLIVTPREIPDGGLFSSGRCAAEREPASKPSLDAGAYRDQWYSETSALRYRTLSKR